LHFPSPLLTFTLSTFSSIFVAVIADNQSSAHTQLRVASLELFCFAATVDAHLCARIARRELGLVPLLVAALPPFAGSGGSGSGSSSSDSTVSSTTTSGATGAIGGGGANDDAIANASTNTASCICARTAAGTKTHTFSYPYHSQCMQYVFFATK
jgi:hypothetical protein